jgi:CubicO group peptidase (beta-lactamase class C family)
MINKDTIETLNLQITEYIISLTKPEDMFSGSLLVSIDGITILNKAYGMANYELNVPNTLTTKYSIGSLTKQFTAFLIMQLIEKGLLQLEDTLDNFIEDYPKGNEITIHHLLTHSSGIYNYTKDEDLDLYMRNYHSLDDLIAKFKNKPLDFEPGIKYSYSNSGYILLGYIIEKITDKTYEKCVNENIFNKLSMNNSGYNDHIKLIKNRAFGYDLEEEKIQNCDFIDASIPYAAGSLYSTIGDLHIWNSALFTENIINKEYRNKMIDKHIKIAENFHYGYGLMIWSKEYGKKIRLGISHDGGTPGFVASNNIFPEDNVEIIILSNLTNGAKDKISLKLREIIFGVI